MSKIADTLTDFCTKTVNFDSLACATSLKAKDNVSSEMVQKTIYDLNACRNPNKK